MEPVTLIIGGTALAVSYAVGQLIKKYQEVKRKNQEIAAYGVALDSCYRALRQYSDSYIFEDCDQQLITQCRKYLSQKFAGNYESNFALCKTMEEKRALAIEVCRELASRMNVQLDEIRIGELEGTTLGTACRENGKYVICLQEALLVADPAQLIKTICHELRHCLQYQALTNNTWGYSPQRIGNWLYSLENYVQCESDYTYEPYARQIIEMDAIKFSEEVLGTNE